MPELASGAAGAALAAGLAGEDSHEIEVSLLAWLEVVRLPDWPVEGLGLPVWEGAGACRGNVGRCPEAWEGCEEVESEAMGPPLFHFLMPSMGPLEILPPGNQASGQSNIACCSAGTGRAPYFMAADFCFSSRCLRTASGLTLGAAGVEIGAEMLAGAGERDTAT